MPSGSPSKANSTCSGSIELVVARDGLLLRIRQRGLRPDRQLVQVHRAFASLVVVSFVIPYIA